MVELLLQNPDLVDTSDDDGFTPLHVAAHRGYSDVLNHLIRAQASVDSQTNHGHTPLITASEMGHEACVDILLASKVYTVGFRLYPMTFLQANVNATASDGCSALFAAAEYNHVECCQHLLQHQADSNLLVCTRRFVLVSPPLMLC